MADLNRPAAVVFCGVGSPRRRSLGEFFGGLTAVLVDIGRRYLGSSPRVSWLKCNALF